MRNALLIVLYNKDIYSSSSIQSFLNTIPSQTELTIWDNSPRVLPVEQQEELALKIGKFNYSHTPENIALSVIYNRFIDLNRDKDLLYLYDDDSEFNIDYFKKSQQAYLAHHDIGLFIPYVIACKKIVSPGYFKYYKGHHYSDLVLGKYKANNMIAITSGMAIAIKRIENLRFDENLKFYGIDTLFTLEYADYFEYIYILDYKLEHELSLYTNEPVEIKLQRIKKYKESSLYFLKKRGNMLGYAISYITYSAKSLILYLRCLLNKIK